MYNKLQAGGNWTPTSISSKAVEKKEKGGEAKGSAPSIYTRAGREQLLLRTLVTPDPISGRTTLLCQYLGYPRAWI